MGKLVFMLIITCYGQLVYAQDRIVTIRDTITANVTKISESSIEYLKPNIDRPLYSISKDEVVMILFEDGTKEVMVNKIVMVNGEYNKLSLSELTKKGNRIFIKFNGNITQRGKDYAIYYISRWGYWEITDIEDFAHFIIEINFEDIKRSKDIKATVSLKSRSNLEIDKPKEIIGINNATTGLNPEKNAAKRIVSDYLKKKYKI